MNTTKAISLIEELATDAYLGANWTVYGTKKETIKATRIVGGTDGFIDLQGAPGASIAKALRRKSWPVVMPVAFIVERELLEGDTIETSSDSFQGTGVLDHPYAVHTQMIPGRLTITSVKCRRGGLRFEVELS